jgi:general secretion pathway protein J
VESLDASGEAERVDDLDVIRDIEEVRFAFLAERKRGEPPQWIEEWAEESIPAAISIRVRIRGQEPWPAIVVAPRIEAQG